MTKTISNTTLDNFYVKLMKSKNFYGGKLIGAGGGFFLMISKNKKKSESFLRSNKISFTNFKIDYSGSQIINNFLILNKNPSFLKPGYLNKN